MEYGVGGDSVHCLKCDELVVDVDGLSESNLGL